MFKSQHSPKQTKRPQNSVVRWAIPHLSRAAIARVKAAALAAAPAELFQAVRHLRSVANAGRFDLDSGFRHPAGFAGPGELALMRERLAANSSLALQALHSLLTVRGTVCGGLTRGLSKSGGQGEGMLVQRHNPHRDQPQTAEPPA